MDLRILCGIDLYCWKMYSKLFCSQTSNLIQHEFSHVFILGHVVSPFRCLPGQSLPDSVKQTYKKGHWTEFMGRVMNYIGKKSLPCLWAILSAAQNTCTLIFNFTLQLAFSSFS